MRALVIVLLAGGLQAQQETPEPSAYTFGTTVVISSGLQGQIYQIKGNTEKLPRFEKLHPIGTIYTTALNVWPQQFDEGFPGITERFEWFAIDYTGKFWIEKTGRFRVSLLSDDGSKLAIDDELVIDNDGLHSPMAASAAAVLTRGVHRIRLSYFQGPRNTVALVLAIAGPGEPWRIFNTNDFKPPLDPNEWVPGEIRDIWHLISRGGGR